MSEFTDWLKRELQLRSMSGRALARAIEMSQSFTQSVMSAEKAPSVEFCRRVASVLDESPDRVMRLAGILPTEEIDDSQQLQELLDIAKQLPPGRQADLVNIARMFLEQNKGL